MATRVFPLVRQLWPAWQELLGPEVQGRVEHSALPPALSQLGSACSAFPWPGAAWGFPRCTQRCEQSSPCPDHSEWWGWRRCSPPPACMVSALPHAREGVSLCTLNSSSGAHPTFPGELLPATGLWQQQAPALATLGSREAQLLLSLGLLVWAGQVSRGSATESPAGPGPHTALPLCQEVWLQVLALAAPFSSSVQQGLAGSSCPQGGAHGQQAELQEHRTGWDGRDLKIIQFQALAVGRDTPH